MKDKVIYKVNLKKMDCLEREKFEKKLVDEYIKLLINIINIIIK